MDSILTSKAKQTMMRFMIYLMIGLTAVLTSCSKDEPDQQMPAVIAFSVINTSPDAGDLDFFFDNQQANSNGFGYLQKVGYFGSYAGNKRLVVKVPGLGQQLLAQTVALEGDRSYSFFIAGKRASLEYVITRDDLTPPAPGKTKIRFVNLSPDAAAVDLLINANPAVFSSQAYKSYTDFVEVDAATVNISLRNSGNGDINATLPGFKFEATKIYTIYAKGLNSETTGEKKFGIEVLTSL
jgi:hypothetical protein